MCFNIPCFSEIIYKKCSDFMEHLFHIIVFNRDFSAILKINVPDKCLEITERYRTTVNSGELKMAGDAGTDKIQRRNEKITGMFYGWTLSMKIFEQRMESIEGRPKERSVMRSSIRRYIFSASFMRFNCGGINNVTAKREV